MWLTLVAIFLLAVGGIGAAASAVQAFAMVGSDPAYGARMGMGIAALLLALLAIQSAALIRYHPVGAGLTALLAAFGGAFAVNAYYINTFYVLAALPWLLGAFLALFSEPRAGSLGHGARVIPMIGGAVMLGLAIVFGGIVPTALVLGALVPLISLFRSSR